MEKNNDAVCKRASVLSPFCIKGSIPGAQGAHATDDAQLLGTVRRTRDAQYNRWETAQSRPGRTGWLVSGAEGRTQGEWMDLRKPFCHVYFFTCGPKQDFCLLWQYDEPDCLSHTCHIVALCDHLCPLHRGGYNKTPKKKRVFGCSAEFSEVKVEACHRQLTGAAVGEVWGPCESVV